MKKIIIAIDGYSACGKSSTAKLVAKTLGYKYIDTGAMYRAVTLHFLDHYVALSNPHDVDKALQEITIDFKVNPDGEADTYLNGVNVENDIREMRVSEKVSEVAAISAVRKAMVGQQQRMGKKKGIVMDGRDIGTVVFPDAELKIFMNAELETRAARRQKELLEKDVLASTEEITQNLLKRDEIDSTRADSPLKKAGDAIEIDTTYISLEEQVEEILRFADGKRIENLEPVTSSTK